MQPHGGVSVPEGQKHPERSAVSTGCMGAGVPPCLAAAHQQHGRDLEDCDVRVALESVAHPAGGAARGQARSARRGARRGRHGARPGAGGTARGQARAARHGARRGQHGAGSGAVSMAWLAALRATGWPRAMSHDGRQARGAGWREGVGGARRQARQGCIRRRHVQAQRKACTHLVAAPFSR